MKTIFMVFFTLFLQAECTPDQREASNFYFAQANQEPSIEKQIVLLKKSLKNCFAYEVEFYWFKLQAQEEEEITSKIELYDNALESLSLIENRKEQVLIEQDKINALLAKLYAPRDQAISDIYQKKVRQKEIKKEKSFFQEYGIYLFGLLMLGWVLSALFKKK